MAKLYYDADANLDLLNNKKVKSDRSHVVLWAKELSVIVVFLRPLGLRLGKSVFEDIK